MENEEEKTTFTCYKCGKDLIIDTIVGKPLQVPGKKEYYPIAMVLGCPGCTMIQNRLIITPLDDKQIKKDISPIPAKDDKKEEPEKEIEKEEVGEEEKLDLGVLWNKLKPKARRKLLETHGLKAQERVIKKKWGKLSPATKIKYKEAIEDE